MKKITLERVAVMVTERCNLRCRLCAPMTPYWENTKDIPLERLKQAMEELFSIVGKVGKFSIGGGGGEPLLSKSLPGFLEQLLQYQDRVDKFDIVTNGTVVPDERLLGVLEKFNDMKVIVDDYGAGVSVNFENGPAKPSRGRLFPPSAEKTTRRRPTATGGLICWQWWIRLEQRSRPRKFSISASLVGICAAMWSMTGRSFPVPGRWHFTGWSRCRRERMSI